VNRRRPGRLAPHIGLALLTATTPVSLCGQRPPDRVAVLRLRDSLEFVTDTATLLALESRSVDNARKHRDDAMVHLRLGLVGLRIAQLTGAASHYRDSESEFGWTTELQPTWPLGWYGLGTAELAEADAYPSALRTLFHALGRDLFGPASHDLARSAEVDSTFVAGLVDLGDDALQRGIGSHLAAALTALREVGSAPAGHNPAMLMVRGRIEREVGDVDSARAMFQSLIARNRHNATALLELARTLLATGRIGGVDPWYRGLGLADSGALAMYRFDLSLVMSDSALRTFDGAVGQGRVTVAKDFWDSRDPDALNGGAERLREHYRRLDYAHRHYALVPREHRYDSLRAFAPTGSRFDDRGRIYVRHGDPDARTSLAMAGLPPNESWVYHRPHGDLLFNFAKPDSAQGYRMYESLLDIVGLGTAATVTGQGDVRARLEGGTAMETYGAAWTAQAAEELLYSRQKLNPLYGRMLSAGIKGATATQQAERTAGRSSIDIGLQTDSWTLSYELPLVADVDVVAVGSDASGPQVQVAFAIPGTALYAPPSPGMVVYPIRMRVALRTLGGALIAAVDTLRNFSAPRALQATDNLLGRLPIHVPPGDYMVRVALETESRGFVTKPQAVHVAALATSALTLSDLALGARSVPLPWQTARADTAWVNPLRQFKAGEPMQLFFEVGGMPAGAAYRAELSVMRSGHQDAQLHMGFNVVAAGTPDQIHREINIGRFASGTYVLQVAVSTAAGRAVRQREFVVIK
jgi:GWxTD domain-containing protein